MDARKSFDSVDHECNGGNLNSAQACLKFCSPFCLEKVQKSYSQIKQSTPLSNMDISISGLGVVVPKLNLRTISLFLQYEIMEKLVGDMNTFKRFLRLMALALNS